ncbi:helicase-related protein [Oerskovia sp. M15]
MAAQHLNDPVEIAVTRQSSTVTSVRQTYSVVPFRHKTGALVRVLATSDADAAIVFTRTRGAAEEVGSALVERGISAATISGDVAQKDRERIVERLRSGALDVLVATDVAARGLDVDRIGLVVNFDLPGEPEAYVHRIGRTGRAGRTGEALSFVTPGERNRLKFIEKTIRATLEEVDVPSPRTSPRTRPAASWVRSPSARPPVASRCTATWSPRTSRSRTSTRSTSRPPWSPCRSATTAPRPARSRSSSRPSAPRPRPPAASASRARTTTATPAAP